MEWEDVSQVTEAWATQVAAPAYDVRRAAACVFPHSDVGYYYHPRFEKVALFAPLASERDMALCKQAAEHGVGAYAVRGLFLTYQELADPYGQWVKIAHSQALHRLGELLNFFPGQYSEGIPNHPSPLAAMLTSGLVGAGLGYGGGKLLGALAPRGYGGNLGRTGMLLGGALGAAPGLAWGGTNKLIGRPFNDTVLADPNPDPSFMVGAMNGSNMVAPQQGGEALNELKPITDQATQASMLLRKRGLDEIQLGERYKKAVDSYVKRAFGDTFGMEPDQEEPTPIDVNINSLGQTLWETRTGPRLAAATMNTLRAAQQFPDSRAMPGYVTGGQMGQFAQAMGQPYQRGPLTGYALNAINDLVQGTIAGAATNTLIGTPYRASTFGLANAGVGLLGAVVKNFLGGYN